MYFKKRNKWLFIGDSVTDAHRDYAREAGHFESLGDGYVSLISQALTIGYPEQEIMVINKGINGNKVTDLALRWEKDVCLFQPDVVFIMIGINDVWRHFDHAFMKQDECISLTVFQKTYQEIIERTKGHAKEIILISPVMFETNPKDSMFAMLKTFQNSIQQLAKTNHLLYIDLQKEVQTFLDSQSSYILTSDRVHPNANGHFLFARTILNELDYCWKGAKHDANN